MATSGLSNYNCPLPRLCPRESGHVSQIIPRNHGITTRKMVPITGRAGSFLELKKIQFQSKLNPINFSLLSSSVSKANLSCVVATILSSLAFPFSSISMANLSVCSYHLLQSCFSFFIRLHDQTEPFGSCIILQSCSSFFFCLHGQPEVFVSDHFSSLCFLSNNTSLQYFESGQALLLMVFCF